MTLTIAARSPCWPARWAILYRKRQCSACGSGARGGNNRRLRLSNQRGSPSRLRYNPPDSMRKAALLYNPLSGRRQHRRLEDVEAARAVLQSAGIETFVAATRSAADATERTRQAIAEGCDTIFACGGDGTIHDVLQGLVGTHAALGTIPLGT